MSTADADSDRVDPEFPTTTDLIFDGPGGPSEHVDDEAVVNAFKRPRKRGPHGDEVGAEVGAVCPACGSAKLVGLGESPTGDPNRFRCPDCGLLDPDRLENPKERGYLPAMDLPGFGERLETCGDPYPQMCESCGDVPILSNTCNKSQCPHCAQNWCRKLAGKRAAKLKALWAYKYTSHVTHGSADQMLFHHLIFSPPDDWVLQANDPYERTVEAIKEACTEMGIEGMYAYHPYRGEEGDDRGAWKRRVFNDREWWDVKSELEHSPHFHLVVVAEHVPGGKLTELINEKTGWTFTRLTRPGDSNVSIGNDLDMAAKVAYILSHAGLYQPDDSDDTYVASQPFGPHTGTPDREAITADESLKKDMDVLARQAAPRVLGIDYNSLACGADVVDEPREAEQVLASAGAVVRDDHQDDHPDDRDLTPRADMPGDDDRDEFGWALEQPGSSLDPGQHSPSPTSEMVATSTSTTPATDDCDSDDVDAGEDQDAGDRCRGRLISIGNAPQFLSDEEWCEQAEHVDRLREMCREWRDRLDWVDIPDHLLDPNIPPPD